MEPFKSDERCITCMFYGGCELGDLPHCNGEDYVADIEKGKELNLNESFIKRRGSHLVAYDKSNNGDKSVLITARINGDKLEVIKLDVLE